MFWKVGRIWRKDERKGKESGKERKRKGRLRKRGGTPLFEWKLRHWLFIYTKYHCLTDDCHTRTALWHRWSYCGKIAEVAVNKASNLATSRTPFTDLTYALVAPSRSLVSIQLSLPTSACVQTISSASIIIMHLNITIKVMVITPVTGAPVSRWMMEVITWLHS